MCIRKLFNVFSQNVQYVSENLMYGEQYWNTRKTFFLNTMNSFWMHAEQNFYTWWTFFIHTEYFSKFIKFDNSSSILKNVHQFWKKVHRYEIKLQNWKKNLALSRKEKERKKQKKQKQKKTLSTKTGNRKRLKACQLTWTGVVVRSLVRNMVLARKFFAFSKSEKRSGPAQCDGRVCALHLYRLGGCQ